MPLTAEQEREINSYLNGDAADGEDEGIVAKKDRILDILLESGEAYVGHVDAKRMGMDPSNRDEDDMADDGVHSRGSKIKRAGWSWKIVEGEAVAMEDDPITKEVAKHTVKQCGLSPRLANMKLDEVAFGSLGAGHCNQWLCCLIDGVPCDYPNISENGIMSKTKCFKDTGIKEACEMGIKWLIIKAQNRSRFPKLGRFIQSALNVKHHIGRGEGWTQLQSKVVIEVGLSSKKNKGKVDWVAVEKAVVRSQPPLVKDVGEHMQYIQKWGGGSDGKFIKATNRYIHLRCPANRHVSASFFTWLSKLDITLEPTDNDENMTQFIQAVVKAHAKGPEVKGENDVCMHISQPDVMSISSKGKNVAAARQATTYMKRGSKVLSGNDSLSERDKVVLLGDLEVNLVDIALRKSNVRPEMNTFEKAIKQFINDISVCSGIAIDELTDESDQSTVRPNLVEFTTDGAVIDAQRMALSSKGFVEGTYVYLVDKDAVHQEQYKIVSISGEGDVALEQLTLTMGDVAATGIVEGGAGGGEGEAVENIVVRYVDFDGVYKLLPANKKLHVQDGWPDNSVMFNVEFYNMSLKAMVVQSLLRMGKCMHRPHLLIQDAPLKAVYTTASISTWSITIPPCTMQVALEDKTKSSPPRSVICTTGADSPSLILSHVYSKDFVAPFWFLRVVDDRKLANMELHSYRVEVQTPTIAHASCRGKKDTIVIDIPCASNFCDIVAGTELVLYREAVVPPEKEKKKHCLDIETARPNKNNKSE